MGDRVQIRPSTRRKLPEVPSIVTYSEKTKISPYEDDECYDHVNRRKISQSKNPANKTKTKSRKKRKEPDYLMEKFYREENRVRLAEIVTNEVDSRQHPMTSGYVNRWLIHSHENVSVFHADCNVCVTKRCEEVLSADDSEIDETNIPLGLKLQNPLTERDLA